MYVNSCLCFGALVWMSDLWWWLLLFIGLVIGVPVAAPSLAPMVGRVAVGGMVGLGMVVGGMALLSACLPRRLSRYTPCGPAAGVALIANPPCTAAAFILLSPPISSGYGPALLVSLLSTLFWVWFSSAHASD